jgi:transcriptional regulator with XRE-family HTH domain
MSTTRPPTTRNVVETATSWKPRRHLPPGLAQAVRNSKLTSGLSWRAIAERSGASHSHLVLVAQGKRVPSRQVAQRIIAALDIDDDTARWLLDEAVERAPAPPGSRGRVLRSADADVPPLEDGCR